MPAGSHTRYDVQDHLTAVTDAEGNRTVYTYSDRDLLTEEASDFLPMDPACGPFPDCSRPGCGCSVSAYNEHGELVSQTDPRGVTVDRTVDELDRVTSVLYPTSSLDTDLIYDDENVPFSLGRLTRIERGAEGIDYRYDRWGRLTRDGALTYVVDGNGNRAEVGYPGGVSAVYGHDYADRPVSVVVERPGEPDQTVVSSAAYLPSGPLASLTLGNGLTETRSFDGRYVPEGIQVAGATPLLDWDYTTDGVGNPTEITDALDPAGSRSYTYQEFQYYLTEGHGPWGTLDWSYDRIGNRLTETRDGLPPGDTYVYTENTASGDTPLLEQVQLGLGGTRDYSYGPAGHLEEVFAGGNQVLFTPDDEGRLSCIERPLAEASADFEYDGRSFLRHAGSQAPVLEGGEGTVIFSDGFESGDACAWSNQVGPTSPPCTTELALDATYSSEGLLHAVGHNGLTADPFIFYFGGRPVALLRIDSGGVGTWTFLSTDHLGSPVLATDLAGAASWQGGFEPFGHDWQAGTPLGAQENGILLRLPGQWFDEVWEEASLGAEVFYNVHRWYETASGRYTKTDPGTHPPLLHEYGFADNRPLFWVDPDGRKIGFPRLPPAHYFPPQLPCVGAGVAKAFLRGSLGPNGNRWAHCYASCRITKCAGTGAAEDLGLKKELLDTALCDVLRKLGSTRNTFCDSAFQPSDFEDNDFGRTCPEDQSCDERCSPLEGASDTPGPFADPPT